MVLTFQTKIKDKSHYEVLDEIVIYLNSLSRRLFVDLVYRNQTRNRLKKDYCKEYQITARQFNSIFSQVKGLIDSRIELVKEDLYEKRAKVKALEKDIEKLTLDSKRCGERLDKMKQSDHRFFKLVEKRQYLKRDIHNKKRKKNRYLDKIVKLEDMMRTRLVKVCFGSKSLFSKQFKKNGLSYKEWRKQWLLARNRQFFCIGSKDERYGNQNCQYADGRMQLRLPNHFKDKYGKYLEFHDIYYPYGQSYLDKCQSFQEIIDSRGKKSKVYQAMNHRFVKKNDVWYIHSSITYEEADIVTSKLCGAVGVDFNVNHLNTYYVDRYGNPIKHKKHTYLMYAKRCDQISALLYDVARDLVEEAKSLGGPLVIENLDFKRRKQFMNRKTKKYRRMLSSFPYQKYMQTIESKCKKEGVEFIKIDPRNTSKEGKKVMKRLGCSSHDAAAYIIARRGLGY